MSAEDKQFEEEESLRAGVGKDIFVHSWFFSGLIITGARYSRIYWTNLL